MTVGNVSMNNIQQQDSSKDAVQIEREIKALQEQIKRVKKYDKQSPEDKAKKIKDLEEKIARLQERKVLTEQKAQQNKTRKAMNDENTENELDDNKKKLHSQRCRFEYWA